jgi:phospholipid/cholesterol/gamma-HCH transport system substrate-binding protein
MKKALKVALLVTLSLAALTYMIQILTLGEISLRGAKTYSAVMENAAGISRRSAVRVAGIDAGQVVEIELVENQARLTLEVIGEIQVYENATLETKQIGYLGDRYFSLNPGTPDHEILAEGQIIPLKAEPVDIFGLANEVAELLDEFKTFVSELNRVFFGAE